MKPTVSIIVPVYNSEKYINECLNSLTNQSYKELQIIVINDGSRDSSGKIIEEFARRNSSIIYIEKVNEGVAVARNCGIERATGKYLLFVDSDDYVAETYVEDLVECAEKNNSELVICGYTLVDNTNRISKKVVPSKYIRMEKEEWAYRICAVCSRLYSRSFWLTHNMKFIQEEGARAEDVPISMYANIAAKNIRIVPKADYFYRQHNESAMHKEQGFFKFPYIALEYYWNIINTDKEINSIEFFYIGLLKLFTQFCYVIYRHRPKEEKREFDLYVCELLWEEWPIIRKIWNSRRGRLEFPVLYKILISFYVRRINRVICKKKGNGM